MHSFSRLGLTALTLVAGVSAFAQSSTSGGISGTILDSGRNPVVGAVVRVASGQIVRTATTGSDGSYRLPLLNPGAYTVTITKSGYLQFSQQVAVSVNEMRTFSPRLAQVASTVVEVVATSATIDHTTTTQGITMDAERLALLPTTGRDFNSVIALAPGVQSTANGFLISGSSSIENSFQVDGLETTDMRKGTQGATLPKEFMEQVEVQTGSFNAEYSALGGVVVAVTKSGSNEFKGSTWFDWDPLGLMPKPKKEGYVAEAPYNDKKFYGATVSGPLIQDKLFYFVGLHGNKEASSSIYKSNQAFDLYDSKYTDDMTKVYTKLNWFITPEQQLAASFQNTDRKVGQAVVYNNGANWVSRANWGTKQKDNNNNWTLNYDWTISSNLILSAKYGHTFYDTGVVPTVDQPLVRDRIFYNVGPGKDMGHGGFSYFTGGAGFYTSKDQATNDSFRADLTWFIGDHAVKGGFSHQETEYLKESRQTGGSQLTINSMGAPGFELNTIEKLVNYQDLTSIKGHYSALYLQDQWEIRSGLKLSYGVRYEAQQIDDPNGNAFFKFTDFGKHLQPRLSVIWDPTGNGSSKVTAGLARYFQKVPSQTPMRQGGGEKKFTTTWSASDGECAYNNTTGVFTTTGVGITRDDTEGFSSTPRAKDLKLPERWEYTLGYEKDFGHGVSAKINGKFRDMKNAFEDSVFLDAWGRPADPLDVTSPKYPAKGSAIFWNPGQSSVSYMRDGKQVTIGSEYTSLFPKAVSRYAGIDFIVEKRSENYFVNLAYTWSHAWGNYEGIASESNGQQDANGTEAYDFWPLVATGNLPQDRRHQIKFQAGYTFKVAGNDLHTSLNWTYMSGNPRTLKDDGSTTNGYAPGYDSLHTVMTPDGKLWATNTDAAKKDPANFTNKYWTGPQAQLHQIYNFANIYGYGGGNFIENRQFGTGGQNSSLNRLDVHIDYAWKFGKKMRLTPSVDVSNLLNRRAVSSWNNTMGDKNGKADAFGYANTFFEGRTYKFGVHFDF